MILLAVKRIIENKNLRVFVAGIVTGIAVIILAFIGVKELRKPHNHYPPTAGVAVKNCEIIAIQLKKYYAEKRIGSQNISISDFFKYLFDKTNIFQFSIEAPQEQYTSPYDLGIYLYLPPKLEAKNVIMIGHTTTFKFRKNYMGIVFFLRGSDILILLLDEMQFSAIVGKNAGKPDFYYWYFRLRYLSDNMPEKDTFKEY